MTSSAFISSARERVQLLLREQTVALFRAVEHARDALLRHLEAVGLEPKDHVRLAGHRADLDALLATDDRCRHAAVDSVRESPVPFAKRLDDRRGVHAGARAEC